MSKLAAAGLSSTVAGAVSGPARSEEVASDRVGAADRLVEVGGSLGPVETGRAESGLKDGAALADQDGGGNTLGDDAAERVEIDPLVPAASDQHERRVERPERGDHGVGLRSLRVVDEADAVDRPTASSRCSTPVKAAAASRIASGATPNASAAAIAARALRRCGRRGSRARQSA